MRILNIAKRHAPDGKEFFASLKNQWNMAIFGGKLNMSFNNKPLTANYIFDLWLNAHYFHNNQEKQRELAQLTSTLTPEFVKFLLANAVTECCKLILILNHTLENLNEPKEST